MAPWKASLCVFEFTSILCLLYIVILSQGFQEWLSAFLGAFQIVFSLMSALQAFASSAPLVTRFDAVQLTCHRRRPRCAEVSSYRLPPSSQWNRRSSSSEDNDDIEVDSSSPVNDAGRSKRSGGPRPQSSPPESIPPLFVEDYNQNMWNSADVSKVFSPLQPDEEELLREKLPRRIAEFLIDRAGDATRLRQPRQASDNSFMGRMLSNLPPDTPDWDDPVNEEYRDYVYVTTVGPPSFRRQNSSVLGGGDGLPEPDEDGLIGRPYTTTDGEPVIRPVDSPDRLDRRWSQPRLVSLFVGEVNSIDEQASRLVYSILGILSFAFVLKLIFAVISFFLSFTFSFFAIFALSAGLFVLFFLFRF